MNGTNSRENARVLVAVGVALAAVGCATGSGSEPAKSAADQAAAMEQARCAPGFDQSILTPVLDREAVEAVEPLYSRAQDGKSGESARLLGAVVRVRPLPGMTAELLDRGLECYSARRVLGRIPDNSTPNDPFWLPGRMVDIDAESARDGFEVGIRGQTVDDAQEILIRANAFVASKSAH
jgi:hypothetical protein